MPARKPGSGKNDEFKKEIRKEVALIKEELEYIRKHVDKLWECSGESVERIQDLEIQVNFLTRMLMLLCEGPLGLNQKALHIFIKRAEKELLRDDQVSRLEDLFRLEQNPRKDKEGDSSSS